MFAIGLIMLIAAVAMLGASFFLPSAALPGLIGAAVGLGIGGLVLTYLDWPARRRSPAPGMRQAEARVVSVDPSAGEVNGYRMAAVVLDVRPKDGIPFQVRRKFVANDLRLQAGKSVSVLYDPIDPDKLELA